MGFIDFVKLFSSDAELEDEEPAPPGAPWIVINEAAEEEAKRPRKLMTRGRSEERADELLVGSWATKKFQIVGRKGQSGAGSFKKEAVASLKTA
jgi:hypothetical protein